MDGQPAAGSPRPPYKAKAIANYFLDLAEREGSPLSAMKLQKLIYFAHGWHLALYKTPLIDERIQAWEFGPVIRTVYDEFKRFGKSPIAERAESMEYIGDGEIEFLKPEIPNADVLTRALLLKVWQSYKHLSAYQLSALTHQPGTPWEKTYAANRGVRNLTIDDGLITESFQKMADDNRNRAGAASAG